MGSFIDLTGERFGHWLVLSKDEANTKKNVYWICRCDCGTIRSVAGTSLRGGISVSCGCEKDKKTSIRTRTNVEDMSGRRFGMWTVLRQDLSDQSTSKRGARWICRCDCGRIKSVLGYALRDGRTTSCGCNRQSRVIDLSGQRFGMLTVIKQDYENPLDRAGAQWFCKCDCGTVVSVPSGRLRSGQTQSCGCSRYDRVEYEKRNLIGEKYGHWNVLRKDYSMIGKGTYYICQCDCGTIRSIPSYTLIKGYSKSCGCQRSIPEVDLTDHIFGRLRVIGVDESFYGSGIHWKCICDCGKIRSYRTNVLLDGKVMSCGCLSQEESSNRLFVDITGERFGRLVAVEVDHKEYDNSGNTEYYWLCDCDCGGTAVVSGTVLRRGDTKSCGCLQAEKSAERAAERLIDLIGKRFGMLTVTERVVTTNKNGHSIGTWKCHCDCGNDTMADGYYLTKGMITSCGCKRQSKYELYVLQYFDEIGFENLTDYECQKRFDDLHGYGDGMLSYDFAVYTGGKLSALIECQGQQHFMPVEMFGGEEQFEKQKLHDQLKKSYAKSIGVPLIEIPYTVETYEDTKSILERNDVFLH